MIERVLDRAAKTQTVFELRMMAANLQFDLGRYGRASEEYSDLIARIEPVAGNRSLARLYYERARCMWQLRLLPEAEADARWALTLSPQNKARRHRH